MRENGVYSRLYDQQPEVNFFAIGQKPSIGRYVQGQITKQLFSWKSVSEGAASQQSRETNMQQLWMRPTIPWKLECDRGDMPRAQAIQIFDMRLDVLGFIDYIKNLGLIVIILMLLPFLFVRFDRINKDTGVYSGLSILLTRMMFFAIFFGMLQIVNIEREQCQTNKHQVQDFNQTNGCGDHYSLIDTKKIIENLNKAEVSLDAMEIALVSVIVLVAIEAFCLCLYVYYCKGKI